MTSNDPISNAILHRTNSNADHPPFLVPIKDSLSTPISAGKQFTSNSKVFTAGSGRKSIKMLRPETIKRANNDACMAAAIGDLAWLQQTLKISDEVALDKNVILLFKNKIGLYSNTKVFYSYKGFCHNSLGKHSRSYKYIEVFN